MPPTSATHRDSGKRLFSSSGPFLILAVLIALASVVGALVVARHHSPSAALALRDAKLAWPYAGVLGLAFCGFRRLAAAIALVGGIVAATYLALPAMLSGGDAEFVFLVIIHLAAAMAAFVELRDETTRLAISVRRLVIGSGAALAIWSLAWLIIAARYGALSQPVGAKDTQSTTDAAAAQRQATATAWVNTTDNLHALTTVAYCLERARGVRAPASQPYPHTLAEWRALVGPGAEPPCHQLLTAPASFGDTLVAELSPHARVRYVPPRAGRADPWTSRGFTLELRVVWPAATVSPPFDAPGAQSYLIDTSGVIHIAYGVRATPDDRDLPSCDATSHAKYCRPYLPRQRWGVTPELPESVLTPSTSIAILGDTISFDLRFTPVAPIDSVRRLDLDWGSPNAQTHLDVPRARSYEGPHRTLVFPLHHAFADTGTRVVHVSLTTSDGTRYQHVDSIAVRHRPVEVSSLGTNADGSIVAGGVAAQTTRALANTRAVMERQGAKLTHLSFCNLSVAEVRDEKQADSAYARFFVDGARRPAWISAVSTTLPPGARVRADCRDW